MSTLLKRPITVGREPKRAAFVAPAVSQVNLLPQQYADRYALGRLKRRLAFALVAVLALAVVLYGAALAQQGAAQDRAAKAEQETTRLLQAQQQYAEVPIVLGELARAEDARRLGMSTEILWAPYLGAIGGVMPEGVTLTNITMDGATPQLAPEVPTHALASESVARINFEAKAAALVDTAAWIDALNGVPGFQEAWVEVVSVDEVEGTPFYRYSSSVRVSPLAYADRFAGED